MDEALLLQAPSHAAQQPLSVLVLETAPARLSSRLVCVLAVCLGTGLEAEDAGGVLL